MLIQKMMLVPNRSYTMKEQDLAPIALKKRLVPTLGIGRQ